MSAGSFDISDVEWEKESGFSESEQWKGGDAV